MRVNFWVVLGLAIAGTGTARGNVHYAGNVPPLRETPFTALPLGSIRGNGWLLKQLEMQRDGLTGHAETALTELDATSAWLGGQKDNWERGPYYVKGLVALAYTLDDAGLKQKAQKWVDWCLASQRADGSYGPTQNDDWWPRMVSNYFLRDYYDATGDKRVLPFLGKYYAYMLRTLPGRPLRDWGKSRAGDEMDTAVWLYDRTREPYLLDLIDLLRKQAYDWPAIMGGNGFASFGKDFQPRHNVNVPQAMKMPAVWWERSGEARGAIDAGQEHLMRDHGLSVGMESGTEFLAGRSPGQGIEFCSIVEQMLSDETVVRIFGEGRYADHLERMAFNALPAAWNRDLTALRYYTLPNHVIAKRGGQGFGQDYHNGIVYGPRSGFPCCCFNVHQGWPKFAQSSWAATSDNGLAVIAYAPTTVTAKVGDDATATIVEETRYPFEETVRLKVTMSAPAAFPLVLRTPGWCEGAVVTVNGDAVATAEAGEFGKVTREWKTGDEVVVKLPMRVRVDRGVYDSVSVHRGPLVYSLKVEADKHVVGRPAGGFDEYEETPKGAWNYALDIGKEIELLTDAGGANPFTPDGTPVRLVATGRRVPEWGLAWNGVVAADPPASPVSAEGQEERLTLVPFGSEDLRVTDFPLVGEPAPNAKEQAYTFDGTGTAGWTWFGGGWLARDGKLRTSPTDAAPGAKALLEQGTYADVRVEAEVTPPEAGDGGVIFRVTKPSIGADAYQGYYAGVSVDGTVILGRADGRAWTLLKRVDHAIPAGKGTKLSVTARGSRIEVKVYDEAAPVISITDDQWKAGGVGVRVYSTHKDELSSAFDNFRVAPLAP